MNDSLVITLLASGLLYGTPLLIAALGEMLAERSGVLNLGVEGMMLVGAVCAFWVSQRVDAPDAVALGLAVLAAAAAGALLSMIHGFACITLRANQIVSGLALAILGGVGGLSSYIGSQAHLASQAPHHSFGPIDLFGLANVPILGPLLFNQNLFVYASWVLVAVAGWYLYRTRKGLNVRAVGDGARAADTMGVRVVAYRYWHVAIGGALAGVAGSCYSLALLRSWSDGITAGAGWIAIALVILAFWLPKYLAPGAYVFGILTGLGYTLQARGVHLPPELFSVIPYVMTIVVLVLVSSVFAKRRIGAPAELGVPYVREER